MKKTNLIAVLALFLALAASACGGKSDADIQKEVTGRVKTPGVTVSSVKDGVVTLGGTVSTQLERDAALAAAKGEGVKNVVDAVQIRPTATMPMTPTTTATQPMANSQMNPSSTGGMNSNAARPK